MSTTSNETKNTAYFATKGTTTNTALEALVKLVVPDQTMKQSLDFAIKKHDWKGRVIFNININRNDARGTLFSNTEAFKFFKKRAIQEIAKVLGHAFFVKVQTVAIEEGLKMNYFLKVRVSKKNEATSVSVVKEDVMEDVPELTQEQRFQKEQKKFIAANTVIHTMAMQKNPFAALAESDDE